MEKNYSCDRDNIASALAGVDEEMTKAGAMVKEMKEVEANLTGVKTDGTADVARNKHN